MMNGQVKRLAKVNAAPSQTWNWLKINQSEFDVLAPATFSPLPHALPDWAAKIKMGAGEDASAWIDFSAGGVEELTATQDHPLEKTIDLALEAASSTALQVQPGAHATINVCSSHLEQATESEVPLPTTAHSLRAHLAEGATLIYNLLVANSDSIRHIENLGAYLEKDAKIIINHFSLGARASSIGLAIELAGPSSEVESHLHYLGRAEEHLDFGQSVLHTAKHTISNIDAAGVLTDKAHKVLRATIDLSRGCKGAEGSEIETVISDGEGVTNKTLPVILCSEDDVAGNHGATIGSISPEQLFYLETRGIDPKNAIHALTTSIFDNAVANLPKPLAEKALAWGYTFLGKEEGENAEELIWQA